MASSLGLLALSDGQAMSPAFFYERSDYDIRRYGALGDGRSHPLAEKYNSLEKARRRYPAAISLDQQIDAAAAQKALDNNAIVYIPPGEFLFDTPLQAAGDAYKDKLIGGAGRTSIIRHIAGKYAIRIGDGESGTSHLQLKDFKILGHDQADAGIFVDRASRLLFSNIRISGYGSKQAGEFDEGGAGMKIYRSWIITVRDCVMTDNHHGIYSHGRDLGVNAVHIGDCTIENNTYSGVYIHGANRYSVSHCTIESVERGDYGIYVAVGRAVTLAENYFENISLCPIYVEDPVYVQGVQIENNYFDAACDHMIILDGAQGATLAGNTFASDAGKALIKLRGGSFTRNVEISGNSLSNRLDEDGRFIDYEYPLENGSVFDPRSGEWTFGENTKKAFAALLKKNDDR
jgi:hypothetical protein